MTCRSGSARSFSTSSVRPADWNASIDSLRRLTSLPATNLGIRQRGALKAGFFADVVVFDPATVADRATYEDPHRYAAGIGDVIVNGRVVIAGGEHTGALPGRVLRPA